MNNKAAILLAVVFGGIGVANIIIYAPPALPKILQGLRGGLSVPPLLIIGLLVCLGLLLVTGILAIIFDKEKR